MKAQKLNNKQKKEKVVDRIKKLFKESKVVGIVDLRNLPDRELQTMKKKLRDKATFIVAKHSLITKAFEGDKKGTELFKQVQGPSCLIFSSMDPFQIFRFFKQNKGKAAAKPGQIAPFDIVVPAGETSLPPGPVLTELKQAGIDARIQGGKVVVGKDSTVVKGGAKITDPVAKGLQKLGIEPFEVGLTLLAAVEAGTVYIREVLDVDETQLMKDFASAAARAMALSIGTGYPTKENIKMLLQKAVRDSRGLAIGANVYEKEVIDIILAKAFANANALNSKVKTE